MSLLTNWGTVFNELDLDLCLGIMICFKTFFIKY